jgi:hypothetical protein
VSRAEERRRTHRGLRLAEFAARYLKAEAAQGAFVPLTPATELHRALADDLGELLAELDRQAGWFQRLEARLRHGYYPPIPAMARRVEDQIGRLRGRLARVRRHRE